MKKVIFSLALLLTGVGTWAQTTATPLTADELNGIEGSLKIAIQCTNNNSIQFYDGTPSLKDWSNNNASFIFEWERVEGDQEAFYVKKYNVNEDVAYLSKNTSNQNKVTYGDKENAVKFYAKTKDSGTGKLHISEFGNEGYNLRLGGNHDIANASGGWTQQRVYRVAKITINNDGTETVEYNLEPERKIYKKAGYTLTVTDAEGAEIAFEGDYYLANNENDITVTYTLVNPALASLQETLDAANAVAWGTTVGSFVKSDVISDAIDAAQKLVTEESTDVDALEEANNALKAAIADLEINIPDPTKFYVLRCAYEDRYLYVDAANNMQYTTKQNSPTSDWTGNYVWQFEGTVNGELKMKSVHTQSYLQTVTNSQAVTFASTNGANVTIAASAYNHGAVTFTAGNENIGIHCNAAPVIGWTNEAGSNHYYFEEVASFSHTLSVGDSQWATLMLAYNTTIPTGVTCYAVTGVDGSAAQLKAVEGTVLPANEAVLVNSTAETCKFAYTSTAGSIENNILNGTLVNTNIAPEENTSCYVLAKPSEPADSPVGFYVAKQVEGKFLNNANKAYLSITGASSARLLFDFGTETAIESIQGAESANAVVYDLAGRRVKGAQKGLYIVNGKKVIK